MLSALASIVSGIGIAMQFVVSFFQGLLSVFSLIASGMVYIRLCIGVLPSVLLVFASAGIGVIIVLHLIGR